MAEKLDMALDDIIKTTKGSRGGSKGGPRRGGTGRGRGSGGRSQGTRRGGGFRSMSNGSNRSGMGARRWNHDMFQGAPSGGARRTAPQPLMSTGVARLNVTNLDFGVSDSDITELFQEFGDLKSAAVHYDRTGRSLGSAQVVFSRYSDAQKAVKQYNGVHLDGKPMKIYIEGDNRSGGNMGGGRPLVKRLNQGRSLGGGRGSGGPNRGRQGSRGRGGKGGRGGRSERPKPKTAEELDAELESYVSEAKKDTPAKTE